MVIPFLAEPIEVLNPSFEYSGGVDQDVKDMTKKPDDWDFNNGWPGGGGIENPASSGVEGEPEADWVCVAVYNTDSIYQLLDHTIVEGVEYNLSFDAYYLWASAGAPYDCTLQGRLYYDDSGSRTVIDYVEDNLSGHDQTWHSYALSTTIPPGHTAIGNKLGVELTAEQATSGGNSWFGFDNVRLSVAISNTATNPIPSSGSSDIDPGVFLYWTAPAGLASPDYDVYLGNSPGSLTLVSPAQSATNYDPPSDLQNDRIYYWQIDTIDGLDVYTGDLWYFTTQRTGAKVFYIDSVTGDDGNDGFSPSQAWKTLTPVNTMTFIPGDRILFKAGTSYTGRLKPLGSGEDGNPIIIDIYDNGDKPRIDGEGNVNPTLSLENVEYYEVSNLEITNTGPTRVAGRKGIGISANSIALPIAHHIHLKNLYVHDVNGSNVKDDGGGTGISVECNGANSRYDDLLIENCHLVRTDRNGIGFWNNWCDPAGDWNPSTNVVIRGNLLEDIGGDGIVPIGCHGALVEYNTLIGGRTRAQDWAAGMWPWGCTDTIFQYNEVSGMVGTKDGQAYDCDWQCGGTIFQYNYSHDNDGGLMLVCSKGGSVYGCRNSIIRYNISENDGSNSRIFHISGNTTNTKIYNNIIYVGSHLNLKMVKFDQWNGGTPDGTQFYNNIFYVDGTVSYELDTHTNTFFENNVFYGNHVSPPSDPYAITSDPMLISPGSGGSGLDSVEGYKLQTGSPCITAGQTIADNGGRDFWCYLLDSGKNPDIGAHAYTHLPFTSDFNNDGRVDNEDVAIMSLNWLTIGCFCDLTGDATTNTSDLRIFAVDWLFGTD